MKRERRIAESCIYLSSVVKSYAIEKFNMRKLITGFFIAYVLSGCSENKIELLDFPNTRQSLDYSCGPSAVQSVLAYIGRTSVNPN